MRRLPKRAAHQSRQNAPGRADAVYRAVGCVVQPGAVPDRPIGGVLPLDQRKNGGDLLSVQAEMALASGDFPGNQFFPGIILPPLVRVSRPPHELPRPGIERHHFFKPLRRRLADLHRLSPLFLCKVILLFYICSTIILYFIPHVKSPIRPAETPLRSSPLFCNRRRAKYTTAPPGIQAIPAAPVCSLSVFFLTFEHLFYIMISQFIEHLFFGEDHGYSGEIEHSG